MTSQRWLTAAEIAALGVPGVPDDRRRVTEWATAEGWPDRTTRDGKPLCRRRAARGGGIEYHVSLLPLPMQEALIAKHRRESIAATLPAAANDLPSRAADRWAWYDQQSASIKAKAVGRLAILSEIGALQEAGSTKGAAIGVVAIRHGISVRAIAGWFADVARVPPWDRLPFLAPRYQGGGRAVEIDAEAWRILKTDYLRPEKPAFAACYRRLLDDYAKPRGIKIPAMKTLQRRMDAEISKSLAMTKRHGREASRRTVPPLRRSVLDLHAMEAVNVDGHTFDVFVEWEDGTISRPVMVGIQDVYSRKVLAHRIGRTESALLTRLAFADLFRDYGIPRKATMDNGRAFASKSITGGALTRFRFKIKAEDTLGILPALGIDPKWTTPYRGSSKPIERAWRDACEDMGKHPFCSGAYTGNKPDAKPENYRERAVSIADFRTHVARQWAAHNAREGRRTEAAKGRSFDATFAESYAVSPIGKATEEQLRMALLEALDRRCHRETGAVTLAGNTYWSPEMIEMAGEKVTIRFDPDNYHQDVHVYRRDGRYFGVASVISTFGFYDKAGSENRSKLEKNLRRSVRQAEADAELLRLDQLVELLSGPPTPAPMPDAGVIRPVRHRGQTAAALKPIQQATPEPAEHRFLDRFAAAVERRLKAVE